MTFLAMNRRKIQVIFLILSVFIYTSCTYFKSSKDEFNPEYAGYISAFTGGVISSKSSVIIEFTQDIPGAEDGEPADAAFLTINPRVEGNLLWKNTRTLEFKPTENFAHGANYEVEIQLGKMMPVPSHLSEFHFSFETFRQFASMEMLGNQSYGLNDYQWMQFKGRITTNDAADPGKIEEMLHAGLYGKLLKISWEHNAAGTQHVFTVDSVERKESAGELILEANPDVIGARQESLLIEQEIPAKGTFKVMSLRMFQNDEQSIQVYFSDPINPVQDITGFFRLENMNESSSQISGNTVLVYPQSRVDGSAQLIVNGNIQNAAGKTLGQDYTGSVHFFDYKPAVQLVGKGVIMPGAKGFKLPFRAVNLRAVEVKIVKVFENNVLQFLQNNSLEGEYELKRVGRLVYKQDIPLVSDKEINLKEWNTFALKLDDMIETEPGAIYRVYIDFKMNHSLYDCDNQEDDNTVSMYSKDDFEFVKEDEPNQYYYYNDEYWDYSEYDYNETENPCHKSYYMYNRHIVSQNILASNIGITVKEDDGKLLKVIVNDLITSEPRSGITVELYNYQRQLVGKARTDEDGFANLEYQGKGFVIVAKSGEERGYLKIDDASARSLSMFEVGGQEITLGIKGFIYTDRGVWRPGDSIYTTLVVENQELQTPVTQPVVFELYTPENQLFQKKVVGDPLHGFYSFHTATEKSSPTGNWTLYAKAGGAVYTKTLKIETVKPNRLKIGLSFADNLLTPDGENEGKLMVKWLHGAVAENLRTVVDMQLQARATQFKGYESYTFNDPTKSFYSDERRIFDDKLNAQGEAVVKPYISLDSEAPGMLLAKMKVRTFENGGDFSTQQVAFNYSPFQSYVGLKVPEGKAWGGALMTDENNLIPIVSLDEKGNPVDRKDIKIEVYEISWRWWWEQSDEEDFTDFISKEGNHLIKTDFISTKGGKANYDLKFSEPSWGRKMIRVIDPVSGHAAGQLFFTSYSGYYSTGGENAAGAEMLSISTDKEEYKTGEEVKVVLPQFKQGRALVALESGSKVLKMFWVEAGKEQNVFSFKATADMAPNVYIEVSFLQPQNHMDNDYPIRLYGVKNISVFDPDSKLEPVIQMKDELAPLTDFSVQVSEKTGKAMTYTLAIVDEGLLDLTSFKTPDPWNHFYEKEALGVKTWDLYPYVMSDHKGELAGLLAIGGGEGNTDKKSNSQNRFIPVVKFIGPFELKAGRKVNHTLQMPNYIGSVRVMLVAGQEGAYGKAEKTVPVKQDLMALGTLPRVIGPKESFSVPVSIFIMNDKLKSVDISIQCNDLLRIEGNAATHLSISKTGELSAEFKVTSLEKTGKAFVRIDAKSGGSNSYYETWLDVRLANPEITQAISTTIKPGETWSKPYQAIGVSGTNTGSLEVSNTPQYNLGKRLNYLIQYPHGCIEQTTSSVFPQLYLADLMDLSVDKKNRIEGNIKAGIRRIRGFQTYSGGFGYWQGESSDDPWGTNYAGHFLLEAKAKGYAVADEVLNKFIKYQDQAANEWTKSGSGYYSTYNDLVQSYRLFTLALAGKPNMGAMNRLFSEKNITVEARYRLALAYQLAGRKDIATRLMNGCAYSYSAVYDDYSYGDGYRNLAMVTEALTMTGNLETARVFADKLAEQMNSDGWYSTQTTAYSLLALSRFVITSKKDDMMAYTLIINKNSESVSTKSGMKQHDFKPDLLPKGELSVKNSGKGMLYISMINTGIPLENNDIQASNNLKLEVRYYDLDQQQIDPARIRQGTDFVVEVAVTHEGYLPEYKNLALTQIFPSGWEIRNTRFEESSPFANMSMPRSLDIRDDRVYTYFNLGTHESKTFRIMLHAAYSGHFYLPSVACEEMYQHTINALIPGKWVDVLPAIK